MSDGGNAKRELVEQLNWIAAEMGKTTLEDQGRLEALKQLFQEMEGEFKVLDQDWPESWRGETRPPDAKERLRQLQEKREIRAKIDAARAEAIAARASRTVPSDPDPQSRDDAQPANMVHPTAPGSPEEEFSESSLQKQETPEDPAPGLHDKGEEAMRLLKELALALDDSQGFSEFKNRAKEIFDQARW